MGLLVDGVWQDQWYDTGKTGGRFVRSESQFRNWVTPDGMAGPTGEGGFAAEVGRYHPYISRACPWAHRTMIFRALKGLESAISFSVTHWVMAEQGWTFEPGPGVIGDAVNGVRFLYEIYKRVNPSYTGRVTVPVLWDKQRRTIVNNESAEIIRMLNKCLRRDRRAGGGLLSRGSAGRNRHPERTHLRHRQQRRLQSGLRHDSGGLRGSDPPAVQDARLARGATCNTALSLWQPPN